MPLHAMEYALLCVTMAESIKMTGVLCFAVDSVIEAGEYDSVPVESLQP